MSPVTTRRVDGRDEYLGADGNWYPLWTPRFRDQQRGESDTARRTRRNNESLARGRHPVTKLNLLESAPPRTCGECAHHEVHRYAKTYHKCELNRSSGPATDIRVSWPACTAFEVAS